MATKIMLIRHAEKPSDAGAWGVNENGERDSNDLTVGGWQRAGALVRFFAPVGKTFVHPALATPAALFAPGVSDHVKSVRSQHTLLPLSRYLSIPVDTHFERDQEGKLGRRAVSSLGTVLIAWEHERIPDLVGEISNGALTCPSHWPDSRFDLVWVLDRDAQLNWHLTQVPQMVLPGDSNEVIGAAKAVAQVKTASGTGGIGT